MNSYRSIVGLSFLVALGLVLGGCPKKVVTPEEEAPVAEEVTEETPEVVEPSIEIGTDYAGTPELPAIRFDYMSANLSSAARETLKQNAMALKAILKAAPSAQVRVEGHCDERGTLEYNLALGQRRANAVRDYYLSFGLPKSAIKTVSYGEERPVCVSSSESCWAENRRGETTLRAAAPISVPLSALSEN